VPRNDANFGIGTHWISAVWRMTPGSTPDRPPRQPW
jgi:hypothetical protein